MKAGTYCVQEEMELRNTAPHVLPIYATSSFSFENAEEGIDVFSGAIKGHSYSRYGNPTVDTVARKLAKLECYGSDLEGTAILTSSGMSAISTLLFALLKNGDQILTQGNLYGGTTELFLFVAAKMGIETVFCDLRDLEQVKEALGKNPRIKALYFETPANPTHACVNIKAICNLAREKGILTIADNTFLTPLFQQPLVLGADFVIHSTTKYLNGHGNSIAGAIIGTDADIMHKEVWRTMKLMGTNGNPFDAWLLNNGLKTLALRMKKHNENALAVATWLEANPKVKAVNYCGLPSHPDHQIATEQASGFGGMLSFELSGGMQAGLDFMNKVKLCTLAPTLGDVDTLVLHPASSSHLNVAPEIRVQNGITDGLIRVSVGIEELEDIQNDLEEAIS